MARPARAWPRSWRERPWAAVPVLLVGVFAYIVGQPLWEPYTSERVPTACGATTAHLPARLNRPVAREGIGTLVAEKAGVAVLVAGGGTAGRTRVYVVQRASGRVVRTLQFASDVVDAGFDGDTLYLFNNKIGYFFDARTGEPVHFTIESDNYRGLFASSGGRFVQTDITVSAVTSTGRVVWHHRFPMRSIVDGCYFP